LLSIEDLSMVVWEPEHIGSLLLRLLHILPHLGDTRRADRMADFPVGRHKVRVLPFPAQVFTTPGTDNFQKASRVCIVLHRL
jgi:hypothetical protein